MSVFPASPSGRRLPAFLFCLVLLIPVVARGLEVPLYRGYVNDYAGMISPAVEQRLEAALTELDQRESTQIAVLTIPSLEGESLEEFSIRVATTWGVGRRGKDNGALLLVARKERKVRIEVGYGLEGRLTDLAAGRIIDLVITPAFRRGDFDSGFLKGVAAMIQAVHGEFQAESGTGSRERQRGSPLVSYLLLAFFFLAFVGRLSRPLGVALGMFLLPLLVFVALPALGLLFLLLLVPLGAVFGFVVPLLFSGFGGHRRYPPYIGGGFGGGGGGMGGGGGFGGFGGGGFGGGGASGGW